MFGESYVTASSLLLVLHLIKEATMFQSDEDGQLTANHKAGIILILEEKYEALPEASRQLMHKATFLDPCYRADYDTNVEETKRMIEEEAVILGRRAQFPHPMREEGDENEDEDEVAAEPQPTRKKTLASLLKRKADTALSIPEKVLMEIATFAQESPINPEQDPFVWWKDNQ